MSRRPPRPGYATPLARWVAGHLAHAPRPPLVVGVHGPQGAGKSTLCARLVTALTDLGHPTTAISVDDFYLTHAEQRALAAGYPGNPYLEHRGYPGTHDVAFGLATLDALSRRDLAEVAVPAYDKSAHAGRGDRLPEPAWPRVATPLDVILLEGWMLAFRPVAEAAVSDAALREPNRRLAAYAPWRARLGALVLLDVADGDLDVIVTWRVDAERRRRAAGQPALSDAETRDFVARFLPAYRLWNPTLGADADVSGPVLRVTLGPDRRPLHVVESPSAA